MKVIRQIRLVTVETKRVIPEAARLATSSRR